jgi:uncharacterized SAM-binding protein YcdF (DUF218 family)
MLIQFLTSLPTCSVFLLLLAVLAFVCLRTGKIKQAKWVSAFLILALFLCTTGYLPRYLAGKLEAQYPVLNVSTLDSNHHYYIHVLGNGISFDERLPATAQLNLIAMGRLTEAMRLYRLLPHCTLVTSAYSTQGLESQASVTRRAAIALGIAASNIAMLQTPATTREEAQAFRTTFGDSVQVIVATDAVHMPRAMQLFKEAGLHPLAAPTNFLVKKGPGDNDLLWIPNFINLVTIEMYLHEILGNIKMKVT